MAIVSSLESVCCEDAAHEGALVRRVVRPTAACGEKSLLQRRLCLDELRVPPQSVTEGETFAP